MKPKDIKYLFPLKCVITDAHRVLAMNRGGLHLLGNVMLEAAIPPELHDELFWGLSIGNIGEVKIKTESFYKDDKGKAAVIPLYLDKNFNDNEVTFKLR